MIAVHPAGFVSEHLPEETRMQVAMPLRFSQAVLEAIEQRRAQHRAVRDVLAEYGAQEWRLAEVLANPTGAEPKRRRIP